MEMLNVTKEKTPESSTDVGAVVVLPCMHCIAALCLAANLRLI